MNVAYVIDEKGTRHTHCHGVTAQVWYDTVQKAIVSLTKPEWRARIGIRKLETGSILCSDPDCKRLNRRDSPATALYLITRDMQLVRPLTPECDGHPYQAGSVLCRQCAIVATAKRMIDAEFKDEPDRH